MSGGNCGLPKEDGLEVVFAGQSLNQANVFEVAAQSALGDGVDVFGGGILDAVLLVLTPEKASGIAVEKILEASGDGGGVTFEEPFGVFEILVDSGAAGLVAFPNFGGAIVEEYEIGFAPGVF